MSDAAVSLEREDSASAGKMKTNEAGAFAFSSLSTGNYRLTAEKSGLRSRSTAIVASSANGIEKVDLVLQGTESDSNSIPSSASGAQAMEFADQPNFTVAGVTDWTAVGGHGSDSTLRTSETLTSETLTLKPESTGHGTAGVLGEAKEGKESESKLRAALANAPNSFDANHQARRILSPRRKISRKLFHCWRVPTGLIQQMKGIGTTWRWHTKEGAISHGPVGASVNYWRISKALICIGWRVRWTRRWVIPCLLSMNMSRR